MFLKKSTQNVSNNKYGFRFDFQNLKLLLKSCKIIKNKHLIMLY